MDLSQKKLFLLDLDGTLYLEETLLPGAAEFLEYVRSRGGCYRFLTNNSSRGVDAGLEKMHRLGVPAVPEEFLTAVEATIHYLRTVRSPNDIYYAVGTTSFCRQIAQAGFSLRDTPTEDVTAVLVGYDTTLTYEKVQDACRLLCRGADFLATNPGLSHPVRLRTGLRLHLRHAGKCLQPQAGLYRQARPHHDSPGLGSNRIWPR